MRMRCDFVEGASVVIAGEYVVCFVVDHPLSDLVGQLTEVILGGGRLEAVMNGQILATIATLPPFGLVAPDAQGLSVVVRGDVACHVAASNGTVVVDGTGVRTWSERHFSSASGVDFGADLGGRAVPFCVQHGVVAASGVRVTLLPADVSPWPPSAIVGRVAAGQPGACS